MKNTTLFLIRVLTGGLVAWVFVFLISACSKKAQPVAAYSPQFPHPPLADTTTPKLPAMNASQTISEVLVPITMDSVSLVRQINRLIPRILFEDTTMQDDKMTIRAEKLDSIDIRIEPNLILYDVPIKLFIEREIGFVRIKADGALKLFFSTAYNIQSNWSVESTTTLIKHEWIETPHVKLGVVRLPIESIANKIVKRSREMLCSSLDDQIQQGFKLREYVDQAWRKIQQPIQITDTPIVSWLLLKPERIKMIPLFPNHGQIQSALLFQSVTDMVFGPKPDIPYAGILPTFEQIQNLGKDSLIELSINFPLKRAEVLLTDYFKGQAFREGEKVMYIDSIQLAGHGNKLQIIAFVSGTYPAKLELEGLPVYNGIKRRFELIEVDYSIRSKSLLVKAASWILKKNIQKKLTELLVYDVGGYMDSGKLNLQNSLSQISSYGFSMEAQVDDIWALHPVIQDNHASIAFRAKGRFNILISRLLD